jgi:hypothetical protein
MPDSRSRKYNREIISRTIAVASCCANARVAASHGRGEEPEIETSCWLELRGHLNEPVEGVAVVNLGMHPEDRLVVGTARPAAVGAIVQLKPEMHAVVRWTHADFDRLWALAAAGALKFTYMAFTRPRRGKSLIVAASCSNELEK